MTQQQIPMPLPLPERLTAEDYFVSDANRDAHGWMMRWPSWPAYGLILQGPPHAGKTHLARLWQARSGAAWLDVSLLAEPLPEVDNIPAGPLVVDGLSRRFPDSHWLLHLLNGMAAAAHSILLVGDMAWPDAPALRALPDLHSRLRALPAVTIAPPDDALLAAVLLKYCSDHQLRPAAEAIPYLLPRMERSFAEARRLIEAVDRAALAGKRAVTVPLVKEVLAGEG